MSATVKYADINHMTPEQIAQSCEDAADLIEGHWTQSTWFQYDEDEDDDVEYWSYCIEGGLAAALGLEQIYEAEDHSRTQLITCPVYDAVLDTLNHRIFDQQMDAGLRPPDQEYRPTFGGGDLPTWNDSKGRSESEVVDLLRATAKRVITEAQEAAL